MKDLYVVSCCRTAVGSFGGSLKDVSATDLGAAVVKEVLNRANVKPEQVDEVMFGCILTAAQGQNPARQVAIKAGIPFGVPAYTVGMVCGSGMKSVIEAARSDRSSVIAPWVSRSASRCCWAAAPARRSNARIRAFSSRMLKGLVM